MLSGEAVRGVAVADRMSDELVWEVAEQLRAVLTAIDAGEIVAEPAERACLAGALDVLGRLATAKEVDVEPGERADLARALDVVERLARVEPPAERQLDVDDAAMAAGRAAAERDPEDF